MNQTENSKLVSGLIVSQHDLISLLNLTMFTEDQVVELSHITFRLKNQINTIQSDLSELLMILQDGGPCKKQSN